MLKAVFFDMDGVLVDSEPIYYELERESFEKIGLKVSDQEHDTFKGMTSEGMWGLLKERYRITEPLEDLIMDARKRGLARLSELGRQKILVPIHGVEVLIRELEKEGMKLVVATSASKARMELILSLLNLERHFKFRVSAGDVTNGKPAPDVFLLAAQKAGVHPGECLVIEDSRNGVLAAKAAGMKCVGYDNSEISQDLSDADLVIDSFEKVDYGKIARICL